MYFVRFFTQHLWHDSSIILYQIKILDKTTFQSGIAPDGLLRSCSLFHQIVRVWGGEKRNGSWSGQDWKED